MEEEQPNTAIDIAHSCDLNPEFAVICSFLAQFGHLIDCQLNIELLKSSIDNQETLHDYLLDLHVKLIKKYRRYFVKDQWEKALIRFASEYSYEHAYELESYGYLKTNSSLKLELLRRLIDVQFECDPKFKTVVNACEAHDLRQKSLGRDIKGNTYWNRSDNEGNFRIFRESPEDHRSWQVVCSKPTELNELIDALDKQQSEPKIKGEPRSNEFYPWPEIFPEYFNKIEEFQPDETNDSKIDIELTNNIKSEQPKKGRQKGKGKTKNNSLLLPQIPEIKTETDNCNSNLLNGSGNPLETKNSKLRHEDIKPILSLIPKLVAGECELDSISDESQIKWTLDNLVQNVAYSAVNDLNEKMKEKPSCISPDTTKPQLIEPKQEPVIPKNEPEEKPKSRRKKAEKFKEEVAPRRTSNRIQQLQLKKIAEDEEKMRQAELERQMRIAAKETTAELEDETSRGYSISSSKRGQRRSRSPNSKSKRKHSRGGKKGRRKGKSRNGKLSWDKDDSDLSGTSSLTESEDEIEDDLDDIDDNLKFDPSKYDDEFACEEEETNMEPVIVKRARTARKSMLSDENLNLDETSVIDEDKPCSYCDKPNDPEWILLCDMCDDGYHTTCCLPPLMYVPDGDWYCPPCEHKMLLVMLKAFASDINGLLEAKERERIKREKLRPTTAIKGDCSKNQPALPSKRERGFLNELNESVALQNLDDELGSETGDDENDIEEACDVREDDYEGHTSDSQEYGKKRKRPSKKSRKSKEKRRNHDNHNRSRPKKSRRDAMSETSESDVADETEDESAMSTGESEDEIVKPKARRARNAVSYRFQEYDDLIKSAIQASGEDAPPNGGYEDDDEEVEEEEEEEEEEDQGNYGRGKDMATIEALAYQQENDLLEQRAQENSNPVQAQLQVAEPPKPDKRPKKKGRRLNDLDADSEIDDVTSDESFQATDIDAEEDDEDDLTEDASFHDSDTSLDELIDNSICRSKGKKNRPQKKRKRHYESDDSEYLPSSRGRRAASKRVSYKESTDEEVEEEVNTRKKKKAQVLSSGDETDASWRETPPPENEPRLVTSQNAANYSQISDSEKTNSNTTAKTLPQPIAAQEANNGTNSAIDLPDQPQANLETKIKDPVAELDQLNSNSISKSNKSMNSIEDPLNQLNQLCTGSSSKTVNMYSSYRDIIDAKKLPTVQPSSVHPPFYSDDEPTASR